MDVLHLFFETKVLNGTEFYKFLNHHKHILFHQFIPKVTCCECKYLSLAAQFKRGSLNANQFDKLYIRQTVQIVKGHEHKDSNDEIKQHCLCQYSAEQQINVDCMDISLMHAVIKACCPVGSIPGDPNTLFQIKQIRNKLVHHGSCSMDINEFEDHWKSLEKCVLKYARMVATSYERKVKSEIQRLKEETSIYHLREVVRHSSETIQEVLTSKLEEMDSQISICLGKLEIVLHEMKEIQGRMDTFVRMPQNKDVNMTEKIDVSCLIDDPEFDADIIRTNSLAQPSQPSEDFTIKSIENKCVMLVLEVSRLILKSVKALEIAIHKLIERIIIAGNIDIKIKRTVNMMLIFEGQVTEDEFSVISAVLSPDIESKEKALKDFELYIKRTETGVFKDEETQIAKVDHSKSQILCPHCSVLFKCQHCTSKDIQIASLEKEISYLRPRMRKQESLMCCQCCADKEKPAFYECKECDKYMCEQCNVKHNTDPALVDHRSKYIDPLKYKVKDTFQIRGIKIRDMKMLNDELLVVADGKENKLITCRIDGRDLMEIMLPMKPFRMAVTDENTVAVSFGSNMKVGLINVTSGESTKEFKLNSSCFAIAYNNMEIFVSCQEKTEDISDSEHTVHVINIHTGELHYKITLSNFTPENMLVGTDARMFFTYYGNKCICTDMTGRNIFDISAKNMIGPWGIAFDNNDGMLIVCNKSKNVHRISTDGGEKKVLFSFPAYIKTTRSSAYICHDNITGSIIIGRGYKFAVFTRT
ncbi:unnamed protein product [Mytilus edulis]|uniref:B box-type domain-containing protein n=1 Tax=Mytilus edulis TaxID=6550 RepID=A0A8S3QHV1_MYTED|nr:unnamed protein product [Mytilus edulis]